MNTKFRTERKEKYCLKFPRKVRRNKINLKFRAKRERNTIEKSRERRLYSLWRLRNSRTQDGGSEAHIQLHSRWTQQHPICDCTQDGGGGAPGAVALKMGLAVLQAIASKWARQYSRSDCTPDRRGGAPKTKRREGWEANGRNARLFNKVMSDTRMRIFSRFCFVCGVSSIAERRKNFEKP